MCVCTVYYVMCMIIFFWRIDLLCDCVCVASNVMHLAQPYIENLQHFLINRPIIFTICILDKMECLPRLILIITTIYFRI